MTVRMIKKYLFRNTINISRQIVPVVKRFVVLSLLLFITRTEAHWKIPEDTRTWYYIETTHFRIHYQQSYAAMALRAALYAENAHEHLSGVLQHRMNRIIPVFIYASRQDFAATNMMPFPLEEGMGGFTDFSRRRVVLPFTGDYTELRHVLSHEIVHAFQFDILQENFGAYPLWLMEGMAEYLTLGWDHSAESRIRDLVLHNRLPSLAALQNRNVQDGYIYYKAGQAIMNYIAETYGEQRIGHFLKELNALQDFHAAFESSFGISPEEFDIHYQQFYNARYAHMFEDTLIKDERIRNVTFRYRDRTGFNIHPATMDDRIIYMSADKIYPAIAIRKIPGPVVSVSDAAERKIILRYLRSSKFEEFQPFTTRLSVSPDQTEILMAGRIRGQQSLIVIDEGGQVLESFSPPFEAMQYPVFSPIDGSYILFTGIAGGRAEIYELRREDGYIRRLTNSFCHKSHPRYSSDERYIYFSANCSEVAEFPEFPDRFRREIFRVSRSNTEQQQITYFRANVDYPEPDEKGGLYFISNHEGIRNIYYIGADRIEKAAQSNVHNQIDNSEAAHAGEIEDQEGESPERYIRPEKITSSLTDIMHLHYSRSQKVLLYSRLEEGATEISLLPLEDRQPPPERVSGPFNPALYRFAIRNRTEQIQTDGNNLDSNTPDEQSFRTGPQTFDHGQYSPYMKILGYPFALITAGSDSDGNTSFAAFGYAAFADDTGDHKLGLFISYFDDPAATNADIRYSYERYRMNFFTGLYRESGTYALFNFLDFSLNNILYNPYFRVLDQNSYGIYAGVEYPLHKFGAFTVTFDQGREERIFRQTLPDEREQDDIFQNHQSVHVTYRYDNAVYSRFGPLDGQALSVSYSHPIQISGNDREIYSTNLEYRFYHLFSNFSTFALRLFAATIQGPDKDLYPFRLGGFYTLRGYDFLEFEGTNAFLLNLEYRFTFIESIRFGFPGRWSGGTVRGVFFADAGSAFDDLKTWQGYESREGRLRDLKASFGVGIHFNNFFRFILPGAIMKIEWATPYDGKTALPLSKWQGEFSLGFHF